MGNFKITHHTPFLRMHYSYQAVCVWKRLSVQRLLLANTSQVKSQPHVPAVRPCGLSQLFNLASIYYLPCSWGGCVANDRESTDGGDSEESWWRTHNRADQRGLFLFSCISEPCNDWEATWRTFTPAEQGETARRVWMVFIEPAAQSHLRVMCE